MKQAGKDVAKRLCVLKFGSSVLATEQDYPAAASEIYRHVREGEKVVAVVSALAGQTDALLDQAGRVGGEGPAALVARLARVGELHSAAMMALALSRAGMTACALDPHEMALVAEGDPLDSNLKSLDAEAVWAKLDLHDVVVVPGFTAGHDEHGVVTLGRGGTDLSAVFFAASLGACRVRLIKDVDGVYDEDPALNPDAQRFAQLNYREARKASAGLIQPKAIDMAEQQNVVVEIASLGAAEATTIANVETRKSLPLTGPRLKVALLGCGAVGAGVLAYLKDWSHLFEVNPVLVRNPASYSDGRDYTSSLEDAFAGRPDIVIECMGGADYSADAMHQALRWGAQVVTANKAAVAKHFDSLHACADAGGGALRYSSAVGGEVPVLERIAALDGSLVELQGVMNGTCNYLLGRLEEGWSFDDAVRKAQELGFAEANPEGDVDGHDAADKLSLLVRAAFGVALPPDRIAKQSLKQVTGDALRAAAARGEVLKQVGHCWRDADGEVHAEVRIEALPADQPLARPRNEENCFVLMDREGGEHLVFGKGAGRWPTATSVFADVMDAQRALLGRSEPAAPAKAPLLMTA